MKTWNYIRTALFIIAGIYISFLSRYKASDWEFYLGLGVILLGVFEGIRLFKKKKDRDPNQNG